MVCFRPVMETWKPIRADDVPRIAAEARDHEHRASLSALAYDVLSRQAEGKALFSGREFVEARASEHGVEREHAETEAGNLLTVLEKGPASPRERGTIAALAVLGFEAEHARAEDRGAVAHKLVRHADWLEVSSPYVVYPFVDVLCSEESASAVWRAVADAVLAEKDPGAAGRARNAARLSALAAASGPEASAQCRRVADEITDAPIRALARALAGPGEEDGPGTAAARVEGELGRMPASPGRNVLRWVTGWAALCWLGRLVGLAAGFRREASVELVTGGLRVHHRTRLLGRVVREGDETFTLSALASAGRRVRYPSLHLVVGLLALSAGVVVGGLLAVDGVRSGETLLLLFAAVAVLVGGGLDLALHVLVPGREGRVAVDLQMLPKRSVRLWGVPAADADAFLSRLGRRVERVG